MNNMERRQNGGERRKIVQDFVKNIDNDMERLVCYLYLNNFDDYEVCKELKIKMKRLKAIKAELRRKLLRAGIRTEEIKTGRYECRYGNKPIQDGHAECSKSATSPDECDTP